MMVLKAIHQAIESLVYLEQYQPLCREGIVARGNLLT